MSQVGSYLFLVVLILVGYLLLIRPARSRAKATSRLQSTLSSGDEVMLNSGVFATIVDIEGEIAHVEVAPGVVLKIHRQAVSRVIVDHPSLEGPLEDDASAGLDETTSSDDGSADQNRGVS